MIKSNHVVIIGAQRSGSTYLYQILNEHPDILMAQPVRPEPKYFLTESEPNFNHYREKYFNRSLKNHSVFGEKSTSYYEISQMPKIINSVIPEAQILFILRNPTYRAISNYNLSVQHGFEKRTIKEVFIKKHSAPEIPNGISVNPFEYLERGNYMKFLKNYMNFFSKENVKVLIFENLIGNVQEVKELYKYLRVNDEFIPESLNKKVNSSRIMNNIDRQVYKELNSYYKEQIIELEDLLGIDLDIWKNN